MSVQKKIVLVIGFPDVLKVMLLLLVNNFANPY